MPYVGIASVQAAGVLPAAFDHDFHTTVLVDTTTCGHMNARKLTAIVALAAVTGYIMALLFSNRLRRIHAPLASTPNT